MSEHPAGQFSLSDRIRNELGELWVHSYNLERGVATARRYLRSVTCSFERDRRDNEAYLLKQMQRSITQLEAEEINDQLNEADCYLGREFPAFAFDTTFNATYSLLEDLMLNLARFMGERLRIALQIEDLKPTGIFAAQVYLEKLCGIRFPEETNAWQQAIHYSRVRNVIAHARGRVKKRDNKIRSYIATKSKLLKISNFGKKFDQLSLSKEFCFEVLDNVEALLKELHRLCEATLDSLG